MFVLYDPAYYATDPFNDNIDVNPNSANKVAILKICNYIILFNENSFFHDATLQSDQNSKTLSS